MDNYYILTGPPGSGKSAVLSELLKRGYAVIEEPARSILRQQRLINGEGVYDINPFLFKELMLSRMINDYENNTSNEPVFFDRGIPDIIVYSNCFDLKIGSEFQASKVHRYNANVFFLPAWKEIYTNDNERRMSFEDTRAFEADLRKVYKDLGYILIEVPLTSVQTRVDFILDRIK